MRFYVRSSLLYKILKYGLIFFFIIMISTVSLPLVTDGAVIPDLVLCAVIAVAIGEDERTAGVCGVAAGFFLDALGGVGLSLSPVAYGFCGYLVGVLVRFLLRRNFPAYLIFVSCAAAANSVITLFFIYVWQDTVPLNSAFADIIVPEYLLTLLASPLLYIVIALPLARKNKQSLKN
ncbi:MAG: rod shape-determining protein MreD [Clostridia bacterium]|nr:rod shape-determining protein MreD [Clostridia bacterium]